jgi:DNA-directed RNA polymerase specialized sigma24 family protein
LRRFFERRMKASFETEDLAQEVFVRLIRQGNMNDIRHLDGYVFQIAANVLRDHARRWAVREEERFHAPLSDDLLEGGFSRPSVSYWGRRQSNASLPRCTSFRKKHRLSSRCIISNPSRKSKSPDG